MTKRIAILIGSPSYEGENFLSGVETDINNMKSFLLSSSGGSWEKDEIKICPLNPTKEHVIALIKSCKTVDFSFVYFSGHGFTDEDDNQKIVLNKKENMNVKKEIICKAKRQITMIDACRSYPTYSSIDGVTMLKENVFSNADKELARKLFDTYITKIPDSQILICATGKGSVSLDNGEGYGGLFSTNLLNAVNQKIKNENKLVFNVFEVFKSAQIATKKIENKQHPKIYKSNNIALELPFAIKPNKNLTNLKSYANHSNENVEDMLKGVLLGSAVILGGIIIGSILSDD